MNGASAELGAIPAAARLWCPVALTAVSLYLRARLHGGEFLIPFVLLGGGLVGWVESRLLARRGHPWDSHRELSFLGGALGLWLSGVVETALLDETGRSHRWPDAACPDRHFFSPR